MHLYIIIPHYKETEKIYGPLFSSINNQENINFDDITVIVGHSSINPFPDVSKYENLTSRTQFVTKYVFPCGAMSRQVALDYIRDNDSAQDSYFILCDVDDELSDSLALSRIFNTVEKNNHEFDLYSFEPQYNIDPETSPFVCGGKAKRYAVWSMVYKNRYIFDHNIHFLPVRVQEDCFFRAQCEGVSGVKKLCTSDSFYRWLVREDSVSQNVVYDQEMAEGIVVFYDDFMKWDAHANKQYYEMWNWIFTSLWAVFYEDSASLYPQTLQEGLWRVFSASAVALQEWTQRLKEDIDDSEVDTLVQLIKMQGMSWGGFTSIKVPRYVNDG